MTCLCYVCVGDVCASTYVNLIYVNNTGVRVKQEKIVRMFYVWAFCRDQTVLDPRAAWRLIDLSASPAEQWL